MKKVVFTPLDKQYGKRLRFDMAKVNLVMGSIEVRKGGPKAVVLIENKLYIVIGCPCDLPDCMCDAYLLEAKEK